MAETVLEPLSVGEMVKVYPSAGLADAAMLQGKRARVVSTYVGQKGGQRICVELIDGDPRPVFSRTQDNRLFLDDTEVRRPDDPLLLEDAVVLVEGLWRDATDYLEEYDRPCTEVEGGWLEPDGESLKDGESAEEYHAAVATVETLDRVLAILRRTSPGWRT